MIVVNEIHDFEEIPPQVQYFVVFGSTKKPITYASGWFFFFPAGPTPSYKSSMGLRPRVPVEPIGRALAYFRITCQVERSFTSASRVMVPPGSS